MSRAAGAPDFTRRQIRKAKGLGLGKIGKASDRRFKSTVDELRGAGFLSLEHYTRAAPRYCLCKPDGTVADHNRRFDEITGESARDKEAEPALGGINHHDSAGGESQGERPKAANEEVAAGGKA